jgi:CheY-like chemotaxis protein
MVKIPLVSIIDDDAIFQFAAKKRLIDTNMVEQILQFPDGEKAIAYFKENQKIIANLPDLIFLDLNMPYLDGWQFLDEFYKIEFETKSISIYICTSSSSTYDLQKLQTYPHLKGYLVKPVANQKFMEILEIELGSNTNKSI